MSSLNRLTESDKVSKKIEESRMEIELLKAEYERTIRQGLILNRHVKPVVNDVNIELSHNINNTRGTFPLKPLENKTSGNVSKGSDTKPPINRSRARRRLSDELDKTTEKTPNKSRSYDVEAAREYMKKQKEKRLEQLRSKKPDNSPEIRKQKLNELHKKSLQILNQNTRARSRSRSRENRLENFFNNADKKSEINFKSSNDSKHSLSVPEQSSRLKKSKTDTKSSMQCDKNDIPRDIPAIQLFKVDKSVECRDLYYSLKKVKAAVIIQSYYRGYKQRKDYKNLLKMKSIENLKPNGVNNRGYLSWFEQEVNSYPHNFISTVKNKLNLVVKSPKKSVDAAVQMTPNDSPKSRQELKELIEKSINTSILEPRSTKTEIKQLTKSNNEEKNKSLVSNGKNNSKKLTLKSFLYENCTDLNLGNVASMKLKSKLSDQSDSDTSKNIPDLTTESVSEKPNISSTSSSIKEISKNLKLSSQKSSESIKSLNVLSNKIMNGNFTKPESNQFLKVPSFNENEVSFCVSRHSNSKKSSNIFEEIPPISFPNNTENSRRKIVNDEYALGIDVENIKKLSLHSRNKNNCSNNLSRSRRDSIISSNQSSYSSYFSGGDKTESHKNEKSPIPKSEEVKTDIENDSVLISSIKTNTLNKNIDEIASINLKNSVQPVSEILPRISDSFHTLRSSTIESSNQESIGRKSKENSNQISKEVAVASLIAPSVSLRRNGADENNDDDFKENRNVAVKIQNNPNQIHLKFEAEVHLLNDFNESLRQYVAVEKSILHLKKKKTQQTTYENRDTQTSYKSRTKSISKDDSISDDVISKSSVYKHPSLNYSRGSDFNTSNFNSFDELNKIISRIGETSSIEEKLIGDESMIPLTTIENTTEVPNQSIESPKTDSFINVFNRLSGNKENFQNIPATLSLGMFEQLMKDEDVRIENLKTVLKIREKALLDRTKGELAWLEIQRKHYLQTGKVQEASIVKKRQRGLIIKLEHEKHEMQKLKEMQKAASKERKNKLKEQHDFMKVQLSANNVPTKIRRSSSKERKSKGPLKVYNYHIQSMQTETNLSHRSSVTEELFYSSRSESIRSCITEKEFKEDESSKKEEIKVVSNIYIPSNQTEIAKQSLLMREASLQKRKKDVEELLQWHRQLLEEEKKIEELEMAASNIIQQMPSVNIENKCNKTAFKGSQLNLLLENMTGCYDKKFNDEEIYNLSQISLERLYQGTESANKKSDHHPRIESSKSEYVESLESDGNSNKIDTLNSINTESEIKTTNGDSKEQSSYTSDFEDLNSQNILHEGTKKTESTLNEIIQNISSITDEISELYKLSSIQNNEELSSDKPNTKDSINTSINEEISQGINTNQEPTENYNESSIYKENSSKNIESTKFKTGIVILENLLIASAKLKEDDQNFNSGADNLKSSELKEMDEIITSPDKTNTGYKTETVLSDAGKSLKLDTSEKINEVNKEIDEVTTNQECTENDIPSLPNESIIESEILHDLNKVEEINFEENFSSENSLVDPIENQNKQSLESSIKSDLDEDLPSSDKKDISTENEVHVSSGGSIVRSINTEITKEDAALLLAEESNILEENVVTQTSKDTTDASMESEIAEEKVSENELESVVQQVSEESIKSNITGDFKHIDPSPLKELQSSSNVSLEESVKSEIEIDDKSSDLKTMNASVVQQVSEESIKSNITGDFDHIDPLPLKELQSISNVSLEESVKSEIEIDDKSSDLKTMNEEVDNEVSINQAEEVNKLISTDEDSPKTIESIDIKTTERFSENSNKLISNDEDSPKTIESIDIKTTERFSENSSPDELFSGDKIETVASIQDSGTENNSIISENDVTDSESSPLKIIDIKFDEKSGDTLEKRYIKDDEIESSESIKSVTPEKQKPQVDVKKRVSEILADVQSNSSFSDKSPRLQDLYVTTYDVNSNENSSESGSPDEDKDSWNSSNFYDHEAEELLRKQLAIEQEIKQLEQQQKEQIPYLFIREIPNKPPPPYKPPVQSQPSSIIAVSPEQIESFIPIVTNILYEAQMENNLKNIEVCEVNDINNEDRACFEFIFHNCQDIAIKHYDQFEELAEISWFRVNKSMKFKKPLNKNGLENLLSSQLKQLFGFEKVTLKESANSRKKRDHVDEVLVIESKIEEPNWTDYDQDELIVKDQVTNEILTFLLQDTIKVFAEIFSKS